MRSLRIFRFVLPILLLALLPFNTGTAQEEDAGIVIGTTDFPRTLDPAGALDYPTWELLNHLYTGLTRQIPGTLTYELALAAEHTISDDGLIHTFAVRPDATFADGTPITAETFADSINRVMTLERDAAELVSEYIAAVEAVNDNAVQFTLHTPLPDFEALVALPPFFPQYPGDFPADDLLTDADASAARIVGNGPYRLESYEPGREIMLISDPAFTGDQPANERIILRRYDLPIELRRALLAHEIDIAWRALALPDLEIVAQDENITIRQQPNLQTYYLLFHHDQEPFDDPAVREGFALLLNRERGADTGFQNTVTPLYSIVPPPFEAAEATFPAFSPAQADAVLQEAGYRPRREPVNVPLYLSTETYGSLMNNAVLELQRGIEESEIVDITFITDDQTSTFTRAVGRGEYLSAFVGWRPAYASPAAYLIPLAASWSDIPTGNESRNEEVDALLQAAALSPNPAERNELYRQVQAILTEHYSLIPLWQGQDVIAFWNDVSGIQVETNSWLRYDLLEKP